MLLRLRVPRVGRCLVSARAGGKGRRRTRAIRGNRASCGMQQKTIQTLYGYWNEVRAGRLAPQRLEIEPSRIAGILSETFMLERVDAAHLPLSPRRHAAVRAVRLGAARQELSGRLERGRPPRACARPRHRLRAGRGRSHQRSRASNDSRHRVELEAVLLPLVHGGQKIGRIIGAMSATRAALARQRAPAEPPPAAPRARLAGWAAARGGRAPGQAGAVPAGARADAHRQDRPAPVSRLRRRTHERQAGEALAAAKR